MIRHGTMSVDSLQESLAHAVLLIARTRGRLAVRGRADAAPLTTALAAVSAALTNTSMSDADIIADRLRRLIDGLGSLVEEMSESRADDAAGRPATQDAVAPAYLRFA